MVGICYFASSLFSCAHVCPFFLAMTEEKTQRTQPDEKQISSTWAEEKHNGHVRCERCGGRAVCRSTFDMYHSTIWHFIWFFESRCVMLAMITHSRSSPSASSQCLCKTPIVHMQHALLIFEQVALQDDDDDDRMHLAEQPYSANGSSTLHHFGIKFYCFCYAKIRIIEIRLTNREQPFAVCVHRCESADEKDITYLLCICRQNYFRFSIFFMVFFFLHLSLSLSCAILSFVCICSVGRLCVCGRLGNILRASVEIKTTSHHVNWTAPEGIICVIIILWRPGVELCGFHIASPVWHFDER